MSKKLAKAKPEELQIWMVSGVIAALGLGVLIQDVISQYAFIIFIAGSIVHLYTMKVIYGRR